MRSHLSLAWVFCSSMVNGVGGGACSIPRLWGEAVRCLGIHPLRTRREAGGVRGALRPQRFRLGSITYSTRTRRWGHADRRARIRSLCPNRSRRHLVEAADMSVTQPVVDQRQESAGCGDSRDLVSSRRSDPPVGVADWWSALVAGNSFDRRPPHQRGALLGDRARVRCGLHRRDRRRVTR